MQLTRACFSKGYVDRDEVDVCRVAQELSDFQTLFDNTNSVLCLHRHGVRSLWLGRADEGEHDPQEHGHCFSLVATE